MERILRRVCYEEKKMLALIMTMVLGTACLPGCGGNDQTQDTGTSKRAGEMKRL